MEIILNGSEIKTERDLHDALKKQLDFPEYYGNNLYALWDCLTAWVEMPLTIIWQDYGISQKNLGEYADKTLMTFQDAEKEVDGFHIKIV